ncbi:PqqD family protein [Streptomyces sp. NPDC048484]|uniref:PqqD family protein n=1 Tax=Streptomyces sp. NPDC048484 TaxID=3155146 RepID=UPI00342659B4
MEDGQLEFAFEWADTSYRYHPAATAMWIALQQHDGLPDLAAAELAAAWDVDLDWVRAGLDAWLSELGAAGLIQDGA